MLPCYFKHTLRHNFTARTNNHFITVSTYLFSMKKNILILFFGIVALTASAQTDKRSPQISVFPNPATEYIKLSDDDAIRSVSISNMLGRKMRTFEVVKGEHYDIGDLPNGLYLIQIVGKNNKILATQRLTKKS